MENTTSTTALSGGTLAFITSLVFLVLKLTGVWNISWFWVVFPIGLSVAIGLLALIVAVIWLIIAKILDK